MRSKLQILFRLFLITGFLCTQQAMAGGTLSEAQFKKETQKLFTDSKSLSELISKMAIPERKKAAINAWVKKNKIDVLPSFALRGSDILLGVENHQTKLTMTDYKRGKWQLNDKPLVIDNKLSVEQNLDALAAHISNNKAAGFKLFPEAHAFVPLVLGAGAIAAVAYGLWSMAKPLDAEDITDDISELLKDNSINAATLKCADDLDENGTYSDFQVQMPAARGGSSGDDAPITMQYLSRNNTLDTFDPIRATTLPSGKKIDADEDSFAYQFMQLAHMCCRKADCQKTFEAKIPLYQPAPSTKGAGKSRSSSTKK